MKRLRTRLNEYDKNLTVKKRLSVSNVIMFLIPILVTAIIAAFCVGIAYYTFVVVYLPRLQLNIDDIERLDEQYEAALASFELIVVFLIIFVLAVIVISIILTNRFLTRFVIRRVSEPLDVIAGGVERIRRGNLDTHINYDRNDEFKPVIEAVNLMTDKLRESAERAQSEEQSRRELYAGISHDLRSPLTGVRAYTEALLDGVAGTPEDERKYLIKIHNRELDIERMVEQIFLFSKMEMTDFPINMQPLNVRDELFTIASENPIDHLNADFSRVPPYTVEADPALLCRIVMNLMENNRKYRKNDTANVKVTAEAADGYVNVVFADDGPGVSDEYLPKLFDAFYRTDPARKNPSGGSGLGLAVVKKALLRMGGDARAFRNEDGGLSVMIILKEGAR